MGRDRARQVGDSRHRGRPRHVARDALTQHGEIGELKDHAGLEHGQRSWPVRAQPVRVPEQGRAGCIEDELAMPCGGAASGREPVGIQRPAACHAETDAKAERERVDPDTVDAGREVSDLIGRGIVGHVEHEQVGPGAAGQHILPDPADQDVVAAAAEKRVVAGIADQPVVA
jgi:hypothetical protein